MTNIKDQNALRKIYKIDKLSQGTISKQLCKNSQILYHEKLYTNFWLAYYIQYQGIYQ